MKTTLQKLQDIQINPSAYNLVKNCLAYRAIAELIQHKAVNSVSVSGSGRRTSYTVFTRALTSALAIAKIPYRVDNFAPRGGQHGEYVAITVKAFTPADKDYAKMWADK